MQPDEGADERPKVVPVEQQPDDAGERDHSEEFEPAAQEARGEGEGHVCGEAITPPRPPARAGRADRRTAGQ